VAKPSGKINQREREVCSRVRLIREQIKWSQPNFAKAIGATVDRLANIEYGRTPLQYDLALNICRTFDIRPGWLASGKEPMRPNHLILWNAREQREFREKDLLTKVFDIAPGDFPRQSDLPQFCYRIRPGMIGPDYDFRKTLISFITQICNSTSFKDVTDSANFALEADSAVEKVLRKYRAKGKAIKLNQAQTFLQSSERPVFISEVMLDKGGPANEIAIVSDITSLADLLKELRKLTKVRGMKAELAKQCQVSRQAVNQWLDETSKPSAEAVFAALKWVIGKRKHEPK